MSQALPSEMHAVAAPEPGGPERLKLLRRPLPRPGPGELLVKVAAAGVNRADISQREGHYPPPPGCTDIFGLELAGEVAALGPLDTGPWRIGDRLCAILAGGGYAEYCAVPAPQALPIPKGLTLVEAGAVPETFFTVWTNVFQRAALQPGETFLVHGGTSGIGTTAIQLARMHGATVIATASGPEKVSACRSLGADRAIDYKAEDFVSAVKDYTSGRGADVILDMVGGDYVARNLRCLAIDGRLVQISFLKGSKVELDLVHLLVKRQTLTGSTLRARSVAQKGAIAAELKDRVWPWIEAGRVKPVIHRTFPLAEAAEAQRLLEEGRHIGKIVLEVG